jgi:hypothetical protein
VLTCTTRTTTPLLIPRPSPTARPHRGFPPPAIVTTASRPRPRQLSALRDGSH